MTKQITLDFDICNRLREEANASDLINSLLIAHYQHKSKEYMTREERKAYLVKQIKIAKAEKALKEMKKGGA